MKFLQTCIFFPSFSQSLFPYFFNCIIPKGWGCNTETAVLLYTNMEKGKGRASLSYGIPAETKVQCIFVRDPELLRGKSVEVRR